MCVRAHVPSSAAQTVNEVPKRRRVTGQCDDDEEACPEWATSGECERNPSFMVGTRQRPGRCLLSCKRCDLFGKSTA